MPKFDGVFGDKVANNIANGGAPNQNPAPRPQPKRKGQSPTRTKAYHGLGLGRPNPRRSRPISAQTHWVLGQLNPNPNGSTQFDP